VMHPYAKRRLTLVQAKILAPEFDQYVRSQLSLPMLQR
jgi:hypothetical protein